MFHVKQSVVSQGILNLYIFLETRDGKQFFLACFYNVFHQVL